MLTRLRPRAGKYVAFGLGLIALFFAVVMAQWVWSLLETSLGNVMVGVD